MIVYLSLIQISIQNFLNLKRKLIRQQMNNSNTSLSQKKQQIRSQSPPVDISFENVSYSVKIPDKDHETIFPFMQKHKSKPILSQVTGIFKGGEVSAVMGASGAGKTTLLNALACRLDQSQLSGSISANQLEYSAQQFGDFANYVMQTDTLMETLTVRETLQFAADLRIQRQSQEKEEAINNLINSLKLQACRNTLVGGMNLKGISGGEKKRTSIAFELISNPQVIFLLQGSILQPHL